MPPFDTSPIFPKHRYRLCNSVSHVFCVGFTMFGIKKDGLLKLLNDGWWLNLML